MVEPFRAVRIAAEVDFSLFYVIPAQATSVSPASPIWDHPQDSRAMNTVARNVSNDGERLRGEAGGGFGDRRSRKRTWPLLGRSVAARSQKDHRWGRLAGWGGPMA